MKLYKTKALVLKSWEYKESDRLLTLLTWEKGKVGAIAHGARKTKSRLSAGVELFTYGEFLLYQGKSLQTVTQVELLGGFPCLREDLEAYGYALYFAELVDKFVVEYEPCRLLCRMLLAAWRTLDEGKTSSRLLLAAFEIKLLTITGYRPHLNGCVKCGDRSSRYLFFPEEGGVVCPRCAAGVTGVSFPCSERAAALGERLLRARFTDLGEDSALTLTTELEQLLEKFITIYAGGYNFKSRSFLEKIKALN